MGLFYTNGVTIWDRSGAIMPNGSEIDGGTSSSQGVVIVPFPGDPVHYYLFTVPSQIGTTSSADHMAYSVIDMSLNGGYGDVTLKNIPLVQYPTEQLTATYHANGRDVWVITRLFASDTWYAYLVTCSGVQPPVVSHAGLVVQDTDPLQTWSTLGGMDVSHAGNRIASTWNAPTALHRYLELLDFDNATGVVSNGTWFMHDTGGSACEGYSVSFSPSDEALYWTELSYAGQSRLWQYDMSAPFPFTTEYEVGTPPNTFGTIAEGRDGKLYIARDDGSQFISRVDQPDIIGPGCGYVLDGVPIAPGYCYLGLSNEWMHEDPPPIDLIDGSQDTTTCAATFTLAITHIFDPPEPDILWSTGETTSSIIVSESGTYSVMAIHPCDTVKDTIVVHLLDPSSAELLLHDTVGLCIGEELVVNAPPGFEHYQWSTGDTGQELVVRDGGEVWLIAQDSLGCSLTDTIVIRAGPCACGVYVPNSFTPNDDGINDRFAASTTCALDHFELRVFDRWGQVLFTAQDVDGAWEGSGTPIGVYPWRMHYAVWNGERDVAVEKMGMVTLVR
jgi:gliding motility-associated-like protein